jgi:glutathione S-transferase
MHSGFQALRNECSMNVGLRVRLHPAALHADLDRLQALWMQGLDAHGGPWLGGADFTAVDAFFAPVATRVQTYALPLAQRAQEYSQRLLEFPAVKEWVGAGIAEPWRDAAHEADVVTHGVVTSDLRAPPA